MFLFITIVSYSSVAAENFGEENQNEPLRLPMPLLLRPRKYRPKIKALPSPPIKWLVNYQQPKLVKTKYQTDRAISNGIRFQDALCKRMIEVFFLQFVYLNQR
jgi:hypothetical protein